MRDTFWLLPRPDLDTAEVRAAVRVLEDLVSQIFDAGAMHASVKRENFTGNHHYRGGNIFESVQHAFACGNALTK